MLRSRLAHGDPCRLPRLPILAQVDGMELDDELLAPNSDDPAEDFTKAFQFEWTGHNDDIPLRCAITFAGEDFSLIDLEDNAQLALVSNFPYPESLLTPNSVRLAGSLDVSTGLDKAIKLAVVTLSLAEKDGGLHGSVATVDAVAADDFYTVLLNALKPQIRKGLFSSERKEIMAELGGHVWVEGELFPISRPLLIKLVIAD